MQFYFCEDYFNLCFLLKTLNGKKSGNKTSVYPFIQSQATDTQGENRYHVLELNSATSIDTTVDINFWQCMYLELVVDELLDGCNVMR